MPSVVRPSELLRTRLDRLTRTLPTLDADDVNSVHKTRVALRRLRELVPLIVIDDKVRRKLTRRLRKMTRRLGKLRELDVIQLDLDAVRKASSCPASALRRVVEDVRVSRQRVRKGLLRRDVPARLDGVIERLAGLLETVDDPQSGPGRTGVRAQLKARQARRAAAAIAAVEAAGSIYLPDRLHRVRIALKKLRYCVELASEVRLSRDGSALRALKRAQDMLGRMHDLQVLIDRVRRVQGGLTPPDLVAWRQLDGLVTGLDGKCHRLHARFIHERPALLALCTRLAGRSAHPRNSARRAG